MQVPISLIHLAVFTSTVSLVWGIIIHGPSQPVREVRVELVVRLLLVPPSDADEQLERAMRATEELQEQLAESHEALRERSTELEDSQAQFQLY
eukprot:scaffold118242_cov48-Prasinocladus_malaysianus.AAC.1